MRRGGRVRRETTQSPEAAAERVLERLRAQADPAFVRRLEKVGIQAEQAFGVPVPQLRRLAREFGTEQALARALWHTNVHEARILAVFIADAVAMSDREIERWLQDIGTWDLCDHFCVDLVKDTVDPWSFVPRWIDHQALFVRRAAFTLVATLAIHDKDAADERFIQLLELVERQAGDSRNLVNKAASWAIRQIGKRNEKLHAAALQLACKLAAAEDSARRWIGRDAARELRKRGSRQPAGQPRRPAN